MFDQYERMWPRQKTLINLVFLIVIAIVANNVYKWCKKDSVATGGWGEPADQSEGFAGGWGPPSA